MNTSRKAWVTWGVGCGHIPLPTSHDLQTQIAHSRWIRRVIVKALPRFPAMHAREDHALEQRRRRVPGLAVLLEHDLGDVVRRVEADEIEQRERTHWIAAAEHHRLIAVGDAPYAALYGPDRVQQIRNEQQVHDEAGVVFRSDGLFARRGSERQDAFE